MPLLLRLLGISLDAHLPQGRRESPLTLVELFALPGAGKSTVAEVIAKQSLVKTRADLSAEWADSSILQRLAHVARSFRNYRRLRAATRFDVGARLNSWESHLRLVRLVAKTEWLKSRSGMVLLDQGFLQDLWSIFLSSNSARADSALLTSMIRTLYEGIDTTVVVLEVDSKTAATRVATRTHGQSRFDSLRDEQLHNSIEAASGLHHQIMESARRAGLRVLAIDGSPPAQIVTDQLIALLPALQLRTEAERSLARPRRISVVGASGSGKTTLAREIAEGLNLPHHELDQLRREAQAPGSPKKNFHNRVAELASGDEWIIDGHYREVRDHIWRRAEIVVWLNYPLPLIALRVVKRFLRKRTASASRAGDSSEKSVAARQISDDGASWRRRFGRLVKTLRERRVYGRLLRSNYPNARTVELRSIKATRRWLRDL